MASSPGFGSFEYYLKLIKLMKMINRPSALMKLLSISSGEAIHQVPMIKTIGNCFYGRFTNLNSLCALFTLGFPLPLRDLIRLDE